MIVSVMFYITAVVAVPAIMLWMAMCAVFGVGTKAIYATIIIESVLLLFYCFDNYCNYVARQ